VRLARTQKSQESSGGSCGFSPRFSHILYDLTERSELQRGRVDAVAQICRRRTIIEDMTQMPVTTGAGDSRALAETPVFDCDNVLGRNRLPETGPTSPRIEFGLGRKERCVTANTAIEPLLVQIPIGACVRYFSIGPTGDIEGVRRELMPPLCVAFDNFLYPGFPGEHACGREFSDLNFGRWSTLQRDRGRRRGRVQGPSSNRRHRHPTAQEKGASRHLLPRSILVQVRVEHGFTRLLDAPRAAGLQVKLLGHQFIQQCRVGLSF
jgi:hypothetical protein